jgi:hypothetical protein
MLLYREAYIADLWGPAHTLTRHGRRASRPFCLEGRSPESQRNDDRRPAGYPARSASRTPEAELTMREADRTWIGLATMVVTLGFCLRVTRFTRLLMVVLVAQ